LAITSEITISAWIKPTSNAFTQRRYVASDYQDDFNIEVMSYVDDNTITYGSNSLTLDSGQIGTISSADISFGTIINGTGPFEATFDSDKVDMPVPESFAGKEFVYDTVRDVQNLSFCAPFEDANLSFFNDTDHRPLVGTLNMTKGNCGTFQFDFSNDWYYVNSSTGSVVGQQHQLTGNVGDGYVLYPMTDDLWGISSAGRYAVGKNITNVDEYTSDNNLVSATRNYGDQLVVTGGGNQGTGPAVHITANQSAIGANQLADADGSEATSYYPKKELSHVFAIPMDAQYIAIATTEPNTTCYMRFANGSVSTFDYGNGTIVNQTISGSLNPPYPNKIHVGNLSPLNPPNYINKSTFFICDALVYAYYEEAVTDDEANMWGLKDPGVVFKPGSYGITYSPGVTSSSNGRVNGYINARGISAAASLDEWHHVLLTYNGSRINLYVDGTLASSGNHTGGSLSLPSALPISLW